MLRTRRLLSSAAIVAAVLTGAVSQAAHPDVALADSTDGTLTVKVDLDVNSNGTYDDEDQPQAGIKIIVSDSAGATAGGETDSDGTYTLDPTDSLVGGRYFVVAEIPPGMDLSPVPESDTYAALSTTVDVTSESQSVRMGVVAKAPEAPPTTEPAPEPTQDPPPVDKPAPPKFAITGDVWSDLNRSGTQDSDEPGVPRISAQLLDSDGDVVDSKVTLPSGHYEFDGLAAGTYAVRFAGLATGHRFTAPGVGSSAADSDADPTGVTAPITLGVGAAGTRAATDADHVGAAYVNPSVDAGIVLMRFAVGDHVWSDLNGDGVQQDNEPPAAASVDLLDAKGMLVATTRTDEQGRYSFTGLTAGTFQVRFFDLPANRTFTLRAAGGDAARDSDAYPATGLTPKFEINQHTASLQPVNDSNLGTADYVESGINAGLIGSYSIGDTVWQDYNGNGVLDPGDAGVKDVTVQLLNPASKVVSSLKTTSTGRYTFRNLPAGSYRVKFRHLPEGLVFTAQGQGTDPAIDSDADVSGFSPVITVGDDNPVDTTIDAGITTPSSFAGSASGGTGVSAAVDTALSSTGGVEPAVPLGGLAMIGLGAGCLLVDRRRRRS